MKKNTFKYTCILLCIVIMLSLCSCHSLYDSEYAIKASDMSDTKAPGVYYEIFVGAFSDHDNDGIGDILGIIDRLDYLNDGNLSSGKSLGVEGLWLMPIMKAGSYHKYDVIDYYQIDKDYGTMEDFELLIQECDKRGIDVIIDLVINHTSEYNSMFTELKKAIKEGDMDNRYIDWYSITTDSKKGWHKLATAPDGIEYFYEGNFSSTMPELNMDNPDVLDEIENIIKFWLDKGVAGFRLDAVKYVYLNDDTKNITFWKWFSDTCKKYKQDVFIVAENWSDNSSIYDYYTALDCFDFGMSGSMGHVALTINGTFSINDYVSYICRYKQNVLNQNPDAILKPFISNHDMDRSAGYLPLDDYRMYMAASLYILTSGNPFIYYGEEIGMFGSRGTSSTDANRRLAMLWGDKDKVTDPLGTSFDQSRQRNGTVKQQIKNKDSLYTHYKKLIDIRRANPEIALGDYTPLFFEGYTLFGGFVASYDNIHKAVLHNISNDTLTVNITEHTGFDYKSICSVVGKGQAMLENGSLIIDAMTSAVLIIKE